MARVNNFEWYGDEIVESVESAIEASLTAAAMVVQGRAILLCPVKTGNLRGSIVFSVDVPALTAYVGSNVEYAPYVEYGTVNMDEQPFLHPALIQSYREVHDIIRGAISEAIGRSGR